MRFARARWAALGLGAFLAGCGGGSSHAAGTAKKDAGRDASGAPLDAARESGGGSGGSGGNDGSAGSDAGRPDSSIGSTVDTTPPTFNGISKIAALTEGSVEVSWNAAVDDETPTGAIGYRVYRASTKGGEDFSHQRRCGTPVLDAGATAEADLPCYVTAVAGATSAVVGDVLPASSFFYVARAIDSAGNEDSNTNESSFTTKDTTAPIFGGAESIAAASARSVGVTWGAAFDTTSPDSAITYTVFLDADTIPDPTTEKPTYTSKPGEHSVVIKGLDPLTTYHVIVEAADQSGNTDDNTYSLAVTTPEGVAPTFDGLKRASADGSTVRLFWGPASDNQTHPENILYDVYSFIGQSHHEDFTKPPRATAAQGASSITLQEVNLATRYYYVVRARDYAGNQDTNIVERSALTGPLPDDTPPTFNGAQAVTGSSPTSLHVAWNSPADDTSRAAADFTYQVFVSTLSQVPVKTPALIVRGSLGGTVVGLQPNTTYNVLVIAYDAAGNASSMPPPASGATLDVPAPDSVAPALSGVPIAAQIVSSPTQLSVSWTAATDAISAATDIRYHVCASTVQADCQGASFATHIAATTAYGTTSTTLSFLDPRTKYYVYVRSEDRAGNVESADHFAQSTTATSWSVNARPIIFNRCVACHDYDDSAQIVNVGSSFTPPPSEGIHCDSSIGIGCQLKLVEPMRPDLSLIYRRVNPLGLKTQPFGDAHPNNYSGALEPRDTVDKLSTDEDDILRDWIAQGAFSN